MKYIIILVFSFVRIVSYSQNKDDHYKILIDSAITLQIKALDDLKEGSVYLIDQNNQSYFLLNENYQKKFKTISLHEKKNRKLLKKGIDAWKIIPILYNNRLEVSIVYFKITYNKLNYKFANGGGAKVVFEYSCKNDRWELLGNKWSGN